MIVHALKKLAYGFSLLFGVISVVFFLFAINPADPARMLGGQFTDETTLAQIRAQYGLDLPLWQRYTNYLKQLSPIKIEEGTVVVSSPDLGLSYGSKKPVAVILGESIPNSLLLAGSAILLALLLGLALGILAALNKGKWQDQSIIALSALGMAGPSFFIGMLVSWLFGFKWTHEIRLSALVLLGLAVVLGTLFLRKRGWKRWIYPSAAILFILGFVFNPWSISLPGTGLPMSGSLYEIDPFEGRKLAWVNLLLPMVTLGIRPLAVIVQLTRNSLLDVLQSDYVRTAVAKGLGQWRVVLIHALPGALNPVITAASGWFAGMLAGAVFVEFIFGWRGLGLELFEALQREDQPVVMGAVLFFAALFVAINITVDLIYAWLDPRIRFNKG